MRHETRPYLLASTCCQHQASSHLEGPAPKQRGLIEAEQPPTSSSHRPSSCICVVFLEHSVAPLR